MEISIYQKVVAAAVGIYVAVHSVPQTWSAAHPTPSPDEAHVVQVILKTDRIPGLLWNEPRIDFTKSDARSVILSGRFNRANWSLTVAGHSLQVLDQNTGDFEITIPFRAQDLSLSVFAIGPRGEKLQESVLIKMSITSAKQVTPHAKSYALIPSVGLSWVSYQESQIANHSQLALTGKVAASYQLPFGFDLGFNSYLNLYPVYSNPSDITIRFLGINVRAGYRLPFIPSPWQIVIQPGLFHTRMFVTGTAFGYTPMTYPQLMPLISREFSERDSAHFYLKYVPISDEVSVFSFAEREIAAGAGWHRKTARGPVSCTVDYSDLRFKLNGRYGLISSSITVGISYGI